MYIDNSKYELWKQRIADFESSGDTVKHWCTENSVPVSTFSYWRRRLTAKPESDVCFAELVMPVTETGAAEQVSSEQVFLQIRYKDFFVSVSEATSCRQLAEIFSAMRQSC